MVKAISLLSGGLDSQLSTRLMLDQGISVIAVHFRTIFCTCPSTVSSGRSNRTSKGCGKSTASKVAKELGISFVEFNNTAEFLEIVKKPKHGYGSGMNPCIDCRILMFKRAKKYMEEIDAGFVVTGEVLGQRPMSQHRNALELIERESGLTGLVVRPLSAQLLPPTIPEKNGWIDRNRLLANWGRSRKTQILLAEKFGMKDYPCPAGGCLLTDPRFSQRVKEGLQYGEGSINDMQFLKIGRHLRLLNRIKLIIGRNESENKRILNLSREGDVLIEPVNVPGPSSVLRMSDSAGFIENYKEDIDQSIDKYLALAIPVCAKYCDGNGNAILKYGVKEKSGIRWAREIMVEDRNEDIFNNDYCRRI